jgi:hypothetical protein
MAEFRHRETGEVKTQNEWIRSFPNTSFPVVWDQDVLTFLEVDPVFAMPVPTTGVYEVARLNGAVLDSKGNWVENWEVVPMFSDYTDSDDVFHSKQEQETEYQTRLDAERSKSVRSERDRLLVETDWIVIYHTEKGTSISTEWGTYRQALRDIPSQSGFPNTIVWPIKP